MVERSEINQMAKFMAALDTPARSSNSSTPAASSPPGDPGVVEMKAILERFHAAADHVVAEAPYDRDLREALITETIDHGARIGSWEIRINERGRRKLYNVINAVNGEALAVDLMLYEAARGLVRILNEGGRINSRPVIELLRAEQEYGGLVQDMVLYRHRLTCSPTGSRTAILEARYGDARRRATQARDRVCKLAETSSGS